MSGKILCPTDFSADSEQALRVAVGLANARDAELVIAHVWYVSPLAFAGEAPIPADVIAEMILASERGLADAARQATSLGATRVSTRFLRGVPWDQIVRTVDGDRAYDLVVIGRRGRSDLARFLVGSVTERVIRHAPCSVLAVSGRAAMARPPRVLCPVDFSESSRHAMLVAGGLAAPRGEITLLHVIENESSYTGGLLDGGGAVDKRATQLVETAADELRAKFDVSVTTRIEIGNPAHFILRMLEDRAFDLVVVGSHGRTGIRRLFLGSVAERVVRHADCPVFVVRSRASQPAADSAVEELPHTD